jgi:nitroimidazol reductase NimA-like FMN-containing flavoprotein (pyridoxamine 5'-phosphate oxidase superfamily)
MITPEMKIFLTKSLIPIRIACQTQSGWPMIVSLWFLYENGNLYCATQKNAKIVAYLENQNLSAIEISADMPPYCGIRCQTTAKILPQRGIEILDRLIIRYLGGFDNPLAKTLKVHQDNEVAIEFTPVNVFSWNFEKRMKGIEFEPIEKFCV